MTTYLHDLPALHICEEERSSKSSAHVVSAVLPVQKMLDVAGERMRDKVHRSSPTVAIEEQEEGVAGVARRAERVQGSVRVLLGVPPRRVHVTSARDAERLHIERKPLTINGDKMMAPLPGKRATKGSRLEGPADHLASQGWK